MSVLSASAVLGPRLEVKCSFLEFSSRSNSGRAVCRLIQPGFLLLLRLGCEPFPSGVF